jgi:GNAT superfamily N-acetyltransferase
VLSRGRNDEYAMSNVRPCRNDERSAILTIINAAAEAYRGFIPDDCWHEPYMPQDALLGDIEAGVAFWGYEQDKTLLGVMGLQPVRDVDLIRHAYVLPSNQGRGIGGELLEYLRRQSTRRLLVGTWAAAVWAIRFYARNGFVQVSPARRTALLKTYWTVPDRQIETSVVLAKPAFEDG